MQEFMNSLDFEFSLHFNSDYAFSNCGWSFKLNRELTPITDFTDIFPFHFPYDTSCCTFTVSLGFCKSATFGLNGGTFSFYVTRFWSTYSLDVSDDVKQEFIEYIKQAVANDRKDNKTEAKRKREAFFGHFL